jgi:transcriptional regulator with XRE-family HTH domain
VAQDVTARQHVRQLGQEQRLRFEELPIRLRAFRDRLGLTQAAFGHTFGGYSARQITSYERGQIEIPLKLLLAIHAKGYLLEAVFGTGPDALLDETVQYLTASYPERTLLVELVAAVLRLVVRDRATIERVLHELELPLKAVTTEQKRLVDQLTSLTPRRDPPTP